jgi:iron complex transport system ATP-binding protein
MLDQVNWEVKSGEHWVVLGPNGSGKTSLLGAITAYATPSLGDIDLLGHRYGTFDWRELRRRVGVVSSAIHVHLHDPEPALRTVASGKTAAFGPWSSQTSAISPAPRSCSMRSAPHTCKSGRGACFRKASASGCSSHAR